MSMRTIIEINHDHLHELAPGGFREDLMKTLFRSLRSGIGDGDKRLLEAFGIRILGQRHHSYPEYNASEPGHPA